MKLFTKLLLIAMCLVLTIGLIDLAIAEQPSYTEFSIPIDYTASVLKDEQVIQEVELNLPNGLSDLLSFNINLKGDFAGAVVKGIVNTSSGIQYCNPNGWTTPNSEGYELRFDCTTLVEEIVKDKKKSKDNIGKVFDSLKINGIGYEVTKASLNVYGDIKINYIDDPQGKMQVFGTEYRPNETATIFLQLKNNQDLPENNGACYLDIYSPYAVNSTPTRLIDNGPMIHLDGSDGLYFYPYFLPDDQGVYMLSATCDYSHSNIFIYEPVNTETNYPSRTVNFGTYAGSPIVLNMFDDYVYETCSSSGGNPKTCEADYSFNFSNALANASNVTDISLYYMGETDTSGVLGQFYVYNYSSASFELLPNTVVFSGSATAPFGINEFVANSVPITNVLQDNVMIIRTQFTSGTNYNLYNNWLSVQVHEANGTITELKGSGEIHINDWFNNLTTEISDDVWSYTQRELTAFGFNVTVDNDSVADIALETTTEVWNYSGNVSDNIITQLSDYITNAVWSFATRTLTFFDFGLQSDYVWNSTTRELSNFDFEVNATINNTGLVEDVWNVSDSNGRYVNGIIIP